ncbi:MAG TPA: type II toxin-antitoxin system Phd/YefM family antitoxin [Gemmataceae bacterium]|jgi:prevent-host-death family protein|nr:type II toxin-antitoxin system Phd/YefM family antitoxin [Gemmataceae bacterium]
MLDIRRDIRTLSEFKRNTVQLVRQLKKTGEPIILTLNGKAEVVILDAASYGRVREALDRLETLEGIHDGLEDMAAGRMLSLEDAREEAAKKYGVQA